MGKRLTTKKIRAVTVDEMERLVIGTEPKKPPRKDLVKFDMMYGREIKCHSDDVGDKYGGETVAYCTGPDADYGGIKKPEEKYDGPDWHELVEKYTPLGVKMEKLEEKHGYDWGYN